MQMRLRHIEPHPQLKGYIDKMWVFESKGRAPAEDLKLIVPNGMAKLTIPFRNGVSGKNKNMFHLSKESAITLIGIGDIPAIVDIEYDAPSGNIGIEFSPLGAYRLFRLCHAELKNSIFLLEDVLGKSARELQQIIANTESIDNKIQILQTYLIKLLSRSEPDPTLDYCIQQIKNSKGLIPVAELERKTNYSARWLYEKFIEKVGLSPKNFSSIIRFMEFYEKWAKNSNAVFFKEDIYAYFYDQVLVATILKGDGKASPAQRRAAFDNTGLAGSIGTLTDKVARCAYKVTDEDIAAAKAAGASEDQIFELVVCSAVGAASRQYEGALAILNAVSNQKGGGGYAS